jgi:hypothetical protein
MCVFYFGFLGISRTVEEEIVFRLFVVGVLEQNESFEEIVFVCFEEIVRGLIEMRIFFRIEGVISYGFQIKEI